MVEVHYEATVDSETWEVSSVEVDEKLNLRELKGKLLEENELDAESRVSFYRNKGAGTKQLALTTKLHTLLPENRVGKPLVVTINQQQLQQQVSSRCSSICYNLCML